MIMALNYFCYLIEKYFALDSKIFYRFIFKRCRCLFLVVCSKHWSSTTCILLQLFRSWRMQSCWRPMFLQKITLCSMRVRFWMMVVPLPVMVLARDQPSWCSWGCLQTTGSLASWLQAFSSLGCNSRGQIPSSPQNGLISTPSTSGGWTAVNADRE